MERTSYETSKALEEAGFKGEHTHVYGKQKKSDKQWGKLRSLIIEHSGKRIDPCKELWNCNGIVTLPAYTFTELWRELPAIIMVNKLGWTLEISKSIENAKDMWMWYGNAAYGKVISPEFSHESPAEAAGQLMLWLIKEGEETTK